ncbi:ATPase [Plantibacter sp. Leaf171]|uniref:helicase HerA-like domain-containing protein n=1 Tax=unclassified Plantibacter TaxID=2624265 RepID=UPI0006F2B8DB|nr:MULTISPECIES: helicase HerA-like domain-containing protein [unclassified Plantibacter]KQM17664.1 ATPase [Plantibacter sp. Leaf1]KQR60445.1 ATPase [Plantibacter sp. Leaf171]
MTPSDAASDPQIAALQAAAEQAQAELEAAQAQAALAAAKVKAAEAAAALAGAGITASGGAPGTAPASAPGEAPTTVVPSEAVAATAEPLATDALPADALTSDTIGPGPLGLDDVVRIRDGYVVHGPALEMGALVNGDPLPGVQVRIPLSVMNRHGLVAGATGTGKTRTLQGLVEQLSAAGVPVFAADIKGDLSGIATPGESSPKLLDRTRGIGQDWTPAATPTEYFALGGVGKGVPIRATIAAFGPLLLSKVLGLNATQESSLGLVFHYADQAGLPLLDLSDLRAVLTYLASDDGKSELKDLGGLSGATVGVILRELITFADQGADVFFGEPEIDTADFIRLDPSGRGIVSLLEVPGVQDQPALYSTFLMWLLADLFNTLPEVGDPEKPKLVFFFDEAHLLFRDASKDFLAQITQTVRLIRSKGVGIFFVTQTPKDVPGEVLAQLGSRVQHALRAFTPDDAKALKATVSTYPTSGYDLGEVLTSLGTGEAVVTVMNEKGAPSPVAWTRLRAPEGLMSPTPDAAIDSTIAASPLLARYGTPVDRESAREILTAKLEEANQAALAAEAELERQRIAAELAKQQAAADKAQAAAQRKADAEYERLLRKTAGTTRRTSTRSTSSSSKSPLEEILGSKATRSILTGVVEGIFGTRRRR